MSFQELLDKLKIEVKRNFWLWVCIVGASLLIVDVIQLKMALYALSMLLLTLFVLHVVRQTLFYYLDLSEFVAKAAQDPKASAIVVFSVFMFLSISIIAVALIVR